jgi:hypothetical protein
VLEAECGGQCLRHPCVEDGCRLPEPLTTHMLVGSGPCQPYSQMRNGCGPANVRDHGGYEATFGDHGSVLSITKTVLPHVSMSEQVIKFDAAFEKDGSHSPKDEYMDQMRAIERPNGLKHFAAGMAVKLDSSLFVEGNRGRWLHLAKYDTQHHNPFSMFFKCRSLAHQQ